MVNFNAKILSVFFFLFVLFSCSENDDNYYKSPLVKKDFKLKKMGELVLHDTTGANHLIGKLRITFATNANNQLHAFYDNIKSRFIITDNGGVIKNIISKKGRGPAEIIKAGAYNFNEKNQLVVYDEGQQMLKIFNLQGKVIHQAKIIKSLFPILGNKLYVYHHNIYSSTIDLKDIGDITSLRENAVRSKLASLHNYQGSLIDTVGQYDPSVKKSKFYNLYSIINVDGEKDHLLSTHWYNYRIQIYDLHSKQRIAWFGRKTNHFNEGDEYISPTMPRPKINEMVTGRSTARGIYTLHNYIILYFETLTKSFFTTSDFNAKKAYITIYDNQSHVCYGEMKLPYILGGVVEGRLYLIEDTNPDHYTIGIYEIQKKN